MAYDCFISYSHRSDAVVAPALEHGLERLARPWYRLRALHVFRDQSDLPLTPSLWDTIVGALGSSRYFVLLASPESAASEWVNREVAHWCETKGTDGLLVVLTGGDIDWDEGAADFSASSTAIPSALRHRFASEPLHLDLRWVREVPDLSWRLSRFRGAIAAVASPMRGLPPDELEGEDIRLHRRARRLAKAAVSGLVVLALIASAAAVLAVANARRATREARVALARQVGLEAIDLPASALDRAFLLSLASADLEAGADEAQFRPTRTLIGRFSRLDRIRSTETPSGSTSVRSVALAADGTLAGSVLTFDASGGTSTSEVLWWPAGAGSPRRLSTPIGVGEIAFVGGTNDHLVLRSGDAGLLVTSDGQVKALPGRVAALQGHAGRALMVDGGTDGPGLARLVDLVDGRVVAELPVEGGVTAAAVHDRVTVVATASRLVLLDTPSGAVTGDVALPTPPLGAEVNEDGSAVATIERTEGPAAALRVWRRQPDGGLAVGDPVPLDLGGGTLRRIVVAPDAGRILVVTDQRTLLVATAGGPPPVVDEGGGGLVAVDPSGRFVAVGGTRLALWDLQTGQRPLAVPERVSATAWGGSCTSGEPCVLTTVGTSIDVWDPLTLTHKRMATETNAQTVAVSQDGSTITTAGWGQSVAVWQLQPRPDATGRRELAPPGALTAFDPRSGVLVRVAGGTAELSGPDSARARSIPVGEAERIILLGGAERLLTVAAGAVRLWDTTSGGAVPLDPACAGDLLATSPDGALVASFRHADRVLAVCDAGSGGRRDDAPLGPSAPSALAVGDDGAVVVGTEDGSLARYPLVDGQFKAGIRIDVGFGGEKVRVDALAVAGGRLAAGLTPVGQGAGAGRVLVWDVAGNGEPIVFDVDQREVAAVALPGDGELLVVAGRDHDDGPVTVQVWESATRRRMGRALDGLHGAVTQLTGNEQEIVGVDPSGHAVRWLLGRDPRQEVCQIVGRPLRADEWAAAASGVLGGETFSAQCP